MSADRLVQDIRYGLRLIRKAPSFSAVAILSLAVGIGASTILFSFANSLVFRPLHAANPEQIVEIFTSSSGGSTFGRSSYADYETFRKLPVFSGILASEQARATLSHDGRRDVIEGLLVSGNYFDVLGLRPSQGRFFRADETETPGAHPIVVLSHDMWRRRFDSDAAISGRVIELNGHALTVVGVAPPEFAGTSIEHTAHFFAPVITHPVIAPDMDLHDRRSRGFHLFGRLRTGVTLAEADAALKVTAAQLLQEDPAAWLDRNGRPRVITALPEMKARFRESGQSAVLLIFGSFMAGVVALLVIACVNVATVLLARASTRRKEIAVRLALGASRRRLIGQLLTECALLAAAGGTLGLLIAQWGAALFARFRPAEMPPFDLTLDYRIVLFSIVASMLTVALFGLAPALQATRPDVNAELKGTARTVRIRGWRFGLRAGLVVTQVALSLALLIGAALMLRSAHAGRTADPGFRRDHVLSVGINLSTIPDRAAHARIYQEAMRVVSALPGVERVALAAMVPMSGVNTHTTVRIDEGSSPVSTSLDINMVSPGYFALLEIPVNQGREFTDADSASSPPVAIVNERMARQFWNGQALGKVFTDESNHKQYEIVGVIRNLRHRGFAEEPRPMIFFPAQQRSYPGMTLHIRSMAPAAALAPAVQRALHDIDRSAGITPAETMADYFDRVMLPQRLSAAGAMATALVELALVVMALYGVIAFAASQRKREIGLRMALGASSRSVVTLIMREGLVLTAVGVVFGMAIAALGGQAIRSELNGIPPIDPVSFAGAAIVIMLVGVAASYVPARRVLRVDPSTSLRSE